MYMTNSKKYVVESALLGQGLISISNNQIIKVWPEDAMIIWLQSGKIAIGCADAFLHAREGIKDWQRLDGITLHEGLRAGANAFLTASATMTLAHELGYPVAVTAGMGGIGDIKAERLCNDLPVLAGTEITLVATSPKDMLDIPATIEWLHDKGVKTYGINTGFCDGYVFIGQRTKLSKTLDIKEAGRLQTGNNLVLNPIPHDRRLTDTGFLKEAVAAGKQAEDDGQHYHPAANKRLDELSLGWSSKIQLDSLVANIETARRIAANL